MGKRCIVRRVRVGGLFSLCVVVSLGDVDVEFVSLVHFCGEDTVRIPFLTSLRDEIGGDASTEFMSHGHRGIIGVKRAYKTRPRQPRTRARQVLRRTVSRRPLSESKSAV